MISRVVSIALFCLGIFCLAQARPGTDSNYNIGISSGSGCALATTYNTANSITGTDATNYQNLICTITNANGNSWAGFDGYWELGAPSAAIALNDLTGTFTATTTGGPTFTAGVGYSGLAAGSVTVNFPINPSMATYFKQNTAFASIWVGNSRAANGTLDLSTISGGSAILLYPRFTGDVTFARINDNAAGSFAVSDSFGLTMGSRTSSSNTNVYKNGALLGANNQVSSAPANDTLVARGDTIGMFSMGQDQSSLATTIFNAECAFKKAYGNAGGLC